MPDAAEATPPSLDHLVGSSSDPLGPDTSSIGENLKSIGRDEVADKERVYNKQERDLHRDQAEVQHTYDGIGPVPDRQWNADEEREKRIRTPLEDFGSLGSIFALAASAFTHQPMINGLNGAAAAMNAARAGDTEGYEAAYDAFKKNADLALRRHDMQRQSYDDAIKKLNSDHAAGIAELQVVAAKYGDKKAQAFIEAGMLPELLEYKQKEAQAAVKLAEARDQLTETSIKQQALESDPHWQSQDPDPQKRAGYRLEAFNRVYHAEKQTPQQQLMARWFFEHPEGTVEEAAKFADEHGIIRQYGLSGGTKGNSTLTVDRQNAKAADEYAQRMRDENPDMSEDDIQKARASKYSELKSAASSPSGNQIDWMKGQRQRITETEKLIDEAEQLLIKHKALTGLGGKITRPGEVISNWFGSDQTDRARFESIIAELREFGPRLLNESKGRPLASEADKIDKIVRGTNAGDTTANTARQLDELRKTLQRFDQGLEQRITGGGTQSNKAPAANDATPTDWLDQYPVKK